MIKTLKLLFTLIVIHTMNNTLLISQIENKKFFLEEVFNDALSYFDSVDSTAITDDPAVLADRYYQNDQIRLAQHYDTIATQNNAYHALESAEKWIKRGHENISKKFEAIALEIGYADPNEAEFTVADLIDNGKFRQAEAFGNKLLEKWSRECDKQCLSHIVNKMALAIKINATNYYYHFKNKIVDLNHDCLVHNYYKYFENKSLKCENQNSDAIDAIINRVHIDSDFLIQHKLTLEKSRKIIKEIFVELEKKNEILSQIIQATSLHAKTDPYFKLHIFNNHPTNKSDFGMNRPYWKTVEVCGLAMDSGFFKGVLMHEICHMLMRLLFKNESSPFTACDTKAKKTFKEIIKQIKTDIVKYKQQKEENLINSELSVFEEIFDHYEKANWSSEAIARFIELNASLDNPDYKNQKFLKRMEDFWMKFVQPEMTAYITKQRNS
ncbi:MAG: hypothetical protein C5B43_02550 [Verrucomicrobia bacterium]|nr:MAG: hypothetical protein C5B43_02550 [Verrucomicrobiota bacterium]